MKTTISTLLFSIICSGTLLFGQDLPSTYKDYWQIGVGLGELPTGGSFKPSITFGYYFNEKVYVGTIYQFGDRINRNSSSFNAQSSALDGLLSSSEIVSQRFLLQIRYTPIKNGPYISGGIVFNGKDKETIIFDDRERDFSGERFMGSLTIIQTRPAGWGAALGLGYQYHFQSGLSVGFEWTPAWGQYPDPLYVFGGTSKLTDAAKIILKNKMDESFKKSMTNLYKVFHIGLAYRFK